MGQIIKFGVVTGLRASEVIESARLLRSHQLVKPYYNPERQAQEHFRFPEIFLRATKKAYISFITKEQLSGIGIFDCKTCLNPIAQCYHKSLSVQAHQNGYDPYSKDICKLA
jgi:hypothetical protein